jgi:DNA helicase-2/ATP-dependent DNA helicase PcrA
VDAESLIADLDPDQRAAVTAESLLVAVVAGAGAGKTRVLTRRIAHRIATGRADARHTLALTFTRESAGELRRRLHRLGLREHVEAGTFHSVMLGLLKQRWDDTGTRPLTVVEDRRRLVGDVLSSGERRGIDGLLAEIGWATARGVAPADYASVARRANRKPSMGVGRAEAVYADFVKLKRRRGVIDFDDVLSHTIRDLRRDNDFAAATRWRFRHLLVDEAQDLNPLQHQIVDLLRAGRDDLFLVGDPAQAIYGFNGADPSLLVDVERRFPGVEIVRLPVNHRSSPQIVRAGVHVLEAAEQPAGLVSNRPDGRPVDRIAADDETDEAARVARLVQHGDPNLLRSGEIAILARTHAQLGAFESAFAALGIDARRARNSPGSPLQAAIRLAAEHGSPSRLRGWAHDTLERVDGEPGAATEVTEAERRVAAAALEFLRDTPRGDGAGFRAWVAINNPFDDRVDGGVELLTFHASKGREWYLVVVSGVETSLVPHRSATTAPQRAEEARLLYVAMTRATDQLVLSNAGRRRGYARKVSPFVDGLDLAEPEPGPPPPSLRRHDPPDPLVAALWAWRDDAARRANVLPAQLCADRDLATIAGERPATIDQLAAATSLGPITAARLAPEILPLVAANEGIGDGVDPERQSARSTITGA